MTLNPYLNFNGTCKEAFEFYQKVLGGQIVAMMTHGETPAAGHTAPEWQDKIIHARLVVGSAVLMGSDAPPQYFQPAAGMTVSIMVDTAEEAERVFAGLSEGGQIQMPMEETFWATRFGMATDKFGTPWMVNCEKSR